MVVQGSVRLVAAYVTPTGGFDAASVRPVDIGGRRTLRAFLEKRQETRRARFRQGPAAYLLRLEEQLLKQALPS